MSEMRCSSCSCEMHATDQTFADGTRLRELRCPRCGDQYIRSDLVIEGDAFEMDPFLNYQSTQRENTQSASTTDEPSALST